MAAFIFLSERFLKEKVKRNMKKALAILLTAVMLLGVLTACGSKKDDAADDTQNTEDTDKAAADNVAALIDAIYVQERTDVTDA